MNNKTVTIASGDGIGPEIMDSVLRILKAAKVPLEFINIDIGKKIYKQGFASGIDDTAWDIIKHNKILLKGPITTSLSKEYKSLNVTLCRSLGLFANIRIIQSYLPYIKNGKEMNVVIVKENEEDLYSGIEYKITYRTSLAMKLITESNCYRIIIYAFEFARLNKRKKVTGISKSNILKLTDGSFQKVFEDVAKTYPEIMAEHILVDTAAAKLIAKPDNFDVIVTLNLYGDILSDISSEVSGSIGLAGSANIGNEYAMFEAAHGSAPDIAGKNIANPSGLLKAAILMLKNLGMNEYVALVHNAWLKTIQDGHHTADIFDSSVSKEKLRTDEFTKAIIKNIKENGYKQISHCYEEVKTFPKIQLSEKNGVLIGVDFFIPGKFSNDLADKLSNLSDKIKLSIVSCKGLMIWPKQVKNCQADMYRYRFLSTDSNSPLEQDDILYLASKIHNMKLTIGALIPLQRFNSELGYSLAQGE